MSNPNTDAAPRPIAAVAGAGPAGLMAAELLAKAGFAVTVFEAMPSPARKFLMAGRGGLNITHTMPAERFAAEYGDRSVAIGRALARFSPDAMLDWLHGLGIATFTGSSGRVFPRCMKASPVLRAWLARLDRLGVTLKVRHKWIGLDDNGQPIFEGPDGKRRSFAASVTVLALGGASWPRLGSTGSWVAPLAREGADIAPLAPANCGLTIAWSPALRERFAGVPLKRIAISFGGKTARGEAIITERGLEGGAVYALSSKVRREIAERGAAQIVIDLRPDEPIDRVVARLSADRGKQSLSTFLRKSLRLDAASIALLREGGALPAEPTGLAGRIKSLRLDVTGCASIERAISTAGGVRFEGLDEDLMLKGRPGVFIAGEMLDWEAPTGGFLLQGTFATAVVAAEGAIKWLTAQRAA